ncbi:hypothetical protein SR42_14205 [Clostridium botulinum]|uniref:hypothetical protein n=1 Tax=Clostridium botulinum TaxID=1491 RepID=UPI0005971294|nr:hypothetical protein [Clostridium botulinum]KIL07335.1 hypothetical protein SR42_14205 [Clostridium botulinum]MBY6934374.1 hypothetical protein [Clostridium botulinum]NFL83340.1 hypothetical protein [Clostridium botulinum]NFN12188.1 hypothetical protein [Clostridium botulinum]NFO37646.1 hypothetical protein [Clostridium botulinum]
MDKAKEIKINNQEVIVNATEIKNRFDKSISSKERKFICLCCGEYLSYVISDKKKPYFRHSNENETTKKCEMRIAYDSQQTIYQRIGLSLYLKKAGTEVFQLYIGFRKIDSSIFDLQVESKGKIIIKSVNKSIMRSCEYILNNYNFSCEYTTLKRVDFISKKYQITYTNSVLEKNLIKVWGEEIEGFLGNEGIFTFNENGGKKIKINEEIETNTEYYYIGLNELIFKRYDNIQVTYRGDLEVNNSDYYFFKYKVYKISFTPINEAEFIKVRILCRDRFRVSLYYNKTEFIDLWPPSIICTEGIKFITLKNQAIGIVETDKQEELYCNDKQNFYQIRLKKLLQNKYMVSIPIRNHEILFTLQEQYNSIFFINAGYLSKIKEYKNQIIIKNDNYQEIQKGIKNMLPLKQSINITSKSRCKILRKNGNELEIKKVTQDNDLKLENIKYGDTITSLYSGKEEVLLQYIKEQKYSYELMYSKLYLKIKNDKSERVDFPIYIKNKLLKSKEYSPMYRAVKIYMFENKIPIKTLKLVEKYFNNKR